MTVFLIGAEVAQPTDLLVAHALEAASQKHAVPAALLRSIAFHDSAFQEDALFRARQGAQDRTRNVNPVLAADYAAVLLSEWFKKYRGSWVHVLAAWRIGPGRVDNMLRGKTWQLTDVVHDYIGDVLAGAGLPRPATISVNGAAQ